MKSERTRYQPPEYREQTDDLRAILDTQFESIGANRVRYSKRTLTAQDVLWLNEPEGQRFMIYRACKVEGRFLVPSHATYRIDLSLTETPGVHATTYVLEPASSRNNANRLLKNTFGDRGVSQTDVPVSLEETQQVLDRVKAAVKDKR